MLCRIVPIWQAGWRFESMLPAQDCRQSVRLNQAAGRPQQQHVLQSTRTQGADCECNIKPMYPERSASLLKLRRPWTI